MGGVWDQGLEEGWGLLGWREVGRGWEGDHTSSWENLSPCVISISLMLQTRERGVHWAGPDGDTPSTPCPRYPCTH